MSRPFLPLLFVCAFAMTLAAPAPLSEPKLLRVPYHSAKTNAERDYFVYLPRGYEQQAKWPVMLFLHGNGERGDGKAELGFVLRHGPLFEAWVRQRDLPFVIISPQLPMFDQGEVDYIKDRKLSDIPERKAGVIPAHPPHYDGKEAMDGQLSAPPPPEWSDLGTEPRGWNQIADEVMAMVDHVVGTYKGDAKRVYVTGLSYGGFGTWYLAWAHPNKFAAMAPVVAYGTPSMAARLAEAKMPMWIFGGGRDDVIRVRHFYPVVNELEKLGHTDVRFTIEADMGHDTWVRVYGGDDLYTWLLSKSK